MNIARLKPATHLLLAACLVLPFAACKKEAAAPTAEKVLSVPAGADAASWSPYLNQVIGNNLGRVTNQPFVYFLGGRATDADFQAKYERQADQIKAAMARGVPGGNLIAFAAPESAKMADIIVASFQAVPAGTMKNVRILFIGAAADKDRVGAAVAPSGADYVFVEAK